MDHHVSSRRSQSLSTVRGAGPELTRRFSAAHRCSMGLGSGFVPAKEVWHLSKVVSLVGHILVGHDRVNIILKSLVDPHKDSFLELSGSRFCPLPHGFFPGLVLSLHCFFVH